MRKFTRQRVERSILPAHRTYLHVTGPHLRCAYVAYIHTLPRGKFLRESPRRCVRRLPRCYYLIRALTRAHESAKLYYEPESYTRALPTESIHTRLILLPHIILNAHGRLALLRFAKSQMIRNEAQKICLRRKFYVT